MPLQGALKPAIWIYQSKPLKWHNHLSLSLSISPPDLTHFPPEINPDPNPSRSCIFNIPKWNFQLFKRIIKNPILNNLQRFQEFRPATARCPGKGHKKNEINKKWYKGAPAPARLWLWLGSEAESISCSTFQVANVQLSVYNKFPGRGQPLSVSRGYRREKHMCVCGGGKVQSLCLDEFSYKYK